MGMTDPALAARFRTLVLPHLDAAYNYARRLTRDPVEAQDLAQESFLRAWRYFASFHGAAAKPWLFGIVRHSFISLREKRGVATMEAADGDEDLAELYGLSAATPSPERALIEADTKRLIEESLDALPLPLREILLLREVEELSYKEIADILDVALGTVMSRLARAREALAAELRRRMKESCDGHN
jgi:RNA polymerase sigma factor (sigma-70 family)